MPLGGMPRFLVGQETMVNAAVTNRLCMYAAVVCAENRQILYAANVGDVYAALTETRMQQRTKLVRATAAYEKK